MKNGNSITHKTISWRKIISLLMTVMVISTPALIAKKKILFLAGPPSHGNGAHEFRAGCMLLANALNESGLDIEAKVHSYGWPKDESIFNDVDACIIYADAGGRLGNKVEFLDKKVKAGMGIMFMHYGVHPSKEVGEKYFKHWIGGFMETGWSVNPHWIADMTPRKGHPVSNGITKPITAFDEFYWNMRFPTKDECDCCHPLATAIPTPEKIVRYINLWNENGDKCFGTEQALMWCRDPKPEAGGRGIGFVGGHYHCNWAIDDFRKLVLNSIVWLARSEVPKGGVKSKTVTLEMLNENLDRPVKGKPVPLPTEALLQQKPMKRPNLEERKKAAEKKKQKKKKLVSTKPRDPNAEWQPNEAVRNVDLEYFKVPEGLEVTRWATSPHLFNPTNMDIDHKGRIWVAEGVNYRRHNGRRPGGDRIAVLEDTNGDGTCDKSHTFVQEKGLIAPLGVAVFDNVVVVSQPPSVIVYTDVDRNLKFDPKVDKREILLTGFNAINHDHSLHSVTAGPDGKWYFNNGNCGAIFTDKSGKTFRMGGSYKSGGGEWPVDNRAVSGQASDDGFVWTSGFSVRMNPDGTKAEIIGHGYRNSYEQCTTSLGSLFQNDNDDPPACRVSYVLEYGSAGYFSRDGKRSWRVEKRPGQDHARAHWRQDDPGTFDMGDIYGGGSPTGIVFYENGALGEKWNGLLLSAEAGKNVIFGYQPKVKGATYQLDRDDFCTTNPEKDYNGSDFVWNKTVKRNKNWKGIEVPTTFRPSDVTVGADGAIYVSDWFDGRVGGHADLDNSCSGAIYRIAPKGFKPQVPAMDLTTTEGQITALSSPANNVRHLGFHGLKKGGSASLDAVSKLLKHPNKWIASRAIWILPHLGEAGLKKAKDLLTDQDPNNRITAYRALQRADINILPFAKKLATDASPAMRRDVALSMRGLPAGQSADILLAVAKGYDGKDKNYLEAIGLGVENQEDAIWKVLKMAMATNSPESWNNSFTRITWRLWPVSAVEDLKARASSKTLSPEQRSFAVESISFINHRSAAEAMLTLAASDSPVKAEASYWLLKRGTGEWKEMNLMAELAKRDIYDPKKIVVNAITIPAPTGKPSFSVKDVLALKGDVTRGKAAIMRCIMCHQAGDLGANYGPLLKGWGQTQTPEVIARSIIEPSADIAHGYGGSIVQLKKGGAVHGLLISNSDPIIIKSTGGVTQMIPRNQVKGKPRYLRRSLMLSADQLGLKAQDVADLVEYMKQWK